MPPAGTVAGIAAVAIAFCIIGSALATLAPKHGMTLAICYALFIDIAFGALPLSLHNVSVSYHAATIAGMTTETLSSGLIGMVSVVALWAIIGLRRIGKIE